MDPFRVPPLTYAHSADDDKITSLTSPMLDPWFYRVTYYGPLKQIEKEFPDLSLKYEPWWNSVQGFYDERTFRMLDFLREVEQGSNIPQIFYMNSRVGGDFDFIQDAFIRKMLKLECYEYVISTPYCGLGLHDSH
jgi:hypothetical protein